MKKVCEDHSRLIILSLAKDAARRVFRHAHHACRAHPSMRALWMLVLISFIGPQILPALASAFVHPPQTQLIAGGSIADDDFVLHLPIDWTLEQNETNVDETRKAFVQKKTHDRLILQSWRIDAASRSFESSLPLHAARIEKIRRDVFARIGLTGYTILEIEKKTHHLRGIETEISLQSRYRNLDAVETQMLERQFVSLDKFFVVTYLTQKIALNDREHAESVLDFVSPRPQREASHIPPRATPVGSSSSRRLPASEVMTGQPVPADGEDDEPGVPRDDDVLGLQDTHGLDMNDPNNMKICADVPLKKRRDIRDVGFSSIVRDTFQSGWGCLVGVKDNLISTAKEVVKIGWDTLKYINPFDNTYRNQVNATVGVIASEMFHSPLNFGERVIGELWNVVNKALGHWFFCLNSKEQMKELCGLASNLLPVGLVAKLATRAPLTLAELAKISEAVKKVFPIQSLANAGPALDSAIGHASNGATIAAGIVGLTGNYKDSFAANPIMQDMTTSEAAKQTLSATLANAGKGLPFDSKEILKAVATYKGHYSNLEQRLLETPGLTPEDSQRLLQHLRHAEEIVKAIRHDYPALKHVSLQEQPELITFVRKLEKDGVDHDEITIELKALIEARKAAKD